MATRDSTRRRLKALADAEVSPLDNAARARITEHVTIEGPKVVRRAVVRRYVSQAGLLALSVGAVIFASTASFRPTARTTVAVAPNAQSIRACERPGSTAPVISRAQEGKRVDVGERARLLASEGAIFDLQVTEPCKTVVALSRGRVLIHAKDLGGGELRVETERGNVVVHGTVFSVGREADRLTVEVAEGRVEVQGRGPHRGSSILSRGQKLEATGDGPFVPKALLEADQRAILTTVAEMEAAPLEGLAQADSGDEKSQEGSEAASNEAEPMAGEFAGVTSNDSSDEASGEATGEGSDEGWEPTSFRPGHRARISRERVRLRDRRRSERAEVSALRRSLRSKDAAGDTDRDPKVERAKAVSAPVAPADLRPSYSAPEPRAALPPRPSNEAAERPEPASNREVPPPKPPSAAELVERGDRLQRSKDHNGARAAYREAGSHTGATAEAAWVALAKLELSLGRPAAALEALAQHSRRFEHQQMEVEAAWLAVRAHTQAGDRPRAQKQAERIVREFPELPQADAAKKWLAEHAAP